MKTTVTIILLLALLASLSNAADMISINNSNTVVKLDERGSGPGGLRLVLQGRKPVYELKNDKVDIDVRYANDTIKYRSRFTLKTSGVPNIQGEFFRNDSITNGNGLGFRVAILGLAEVNPGKGWNLATSGNTIKFPGSGSMWTPITVTNMTGDNGVIVRKFLTSYKNATLPNFNVTVDAYLTPNDTTLMGLSLKPYSFKYGLEINNFPYVYNDSQIAIVKAVFYKSSDKGPDFSVQNRSLSVSGGCRFNWTSTLTYTSVNGTADDAITPDNTTSSDTNSVGVKVDNDPDKNGSEGAAVIVFRTKTGNFSRLAWDPEVVLNDDSLAQTTSSGSGTTSGATMTTTSFGLTLIVLFVTLFMNL